MENKIELVKFPPFLTDEERKLLETELLNAYCDIQNTIEKNKVLIYNGYTIAFNDIELMIITRSIERKEFCFSIRHKLMTLLFSGGKVALLDNKTSSKEECKRILLELGKEIKNIPEKLKEKFNKYRENFAKLLSLNIGLEVLLLGNEHNLVSSIGEYFTKTCLSHIRFQKFEDIFISLKQGFTQAKFFEGGIDALVNALNKTKDKINIAVEDLQKVVKDIDSLQEELIRIKEEKDGNNGSS